MDQKSSKMEIMTDYILGIKEIDDSIGGIRKGSSVMLMGPSMVGKEAMLHNIMYYGAERNKNAIITVAMRESATSILEWFEKKKLQLPLSRIGIVDCISRASNVDIAENEHIRLVNSPMDLTGIGVKISQLLEELTKYNQGVQLHINSLSTMLMYSNIQTVFKFLHILSCRIKANGWLGIYVIESGMHGEQTMAILKHLVDCIIEFKSENDRNFIQITGLSLKPSQFFECETTAYQGPKLLKV